jgi:hypothetical protein
MTAGRNDKGQFLFIEARWTLDPLTGCWVWLLHTTKKGYGRMNYKGRNRYAHRVLYEQMKGEIPAGKILDHKCRNPICVNPDHLEPVTIAVNNRRGLKTKLTQENVNEIRELHRTRSSRYGWRTEVKARFGIGNSQITRIISEKQWR